MVARGVFICEGSSDQPLGDIVEDLFKSRGFNVRLTTPEIDRLGDRKPGSVLAKLGLVVISRRRHRIFWSSTEMRMVPIPDLG